MVDELPLGGAILLRTTDDEDDHRYHILFANHPKGKGFFMSLRLLLGMRIEKVLLQCSEL